MLNLASLPCERALGNRPDFERDKKMSAILRLSALAASLLIVAAVPANAADKISDKKSCNDSYNVVLDAAEEGDLGAKAEREVEQLIASMKSQCEADQFAEAEKTAEQIRGMLASENDSGKEDDKKS